MTHNLDELGKIRLPELKKIAKDFNILGIENYLKSELIIQIRKAAEEQKKTQSLLFTVDGRRLKNERPTKGGTQGGGSNDSVAPLPSAPLGSHLRATAAAFALFPLALFALA